MKKYIYLSLFLIVFSAASCHKKAEESYRAIEMAEDNILATDKTVSSFANYAPAEENSLPVPASPKEENSVEKKLIKTANINLSSKNITKSKTAIDTLVKKYKGYYENENFSNDYNLSYSLTVRIPASGFDTFLSTVENGNDKLTEKNISTTDVTAQYIDLESRIKSKRTYLARLNELAKQAKTVKDLLEVDEQTRTLIEEIESSEQQFRYLSKQISFSTITIYISQEKEYSPAQRESFGKQILESLEQGWSILRHLFFFLITIWPLYIIAALVIYSIKKLKKRKLNHGNK
jgi:hypothetical protein